VPDSFVRMSWAVSTAEHSQTYDLNMPQHASSRVQNLRDEHGADGLVEDRLEPSLVEGGALEILDSPNLVGQSPALQNDRPKAIHD
jgi:hypothetical protein